MWRPDVHADVRVTGSGTVYLLELLTDDARAWVEAHVSSERQMFGRALAVEHRYVGPLLDGMATDGLVVDLAEVLR